MSSIGCDGQHLLFVAIERIGVEAQLFFPEYLVEASKEITRLRAQFPRAVRFAERVENLGHADPGAVDIALELTERLRPFDERTVGIHDGIARILPAHVLVTDRRARLVLLKPIAIAIAVVVDPR